MPKNEKSTTQVIDENELADAEIEDTLPMLMNGEKKVRYFKDRRANTNSLDITCFFLIV